MINTDAEVLARLKGPATKETPEDTTKSKNIFLEFEEGKQAIETGKKREWLMEADKYNSGNALIEELGDFVVKVDHVGSTAVPGIIAKPWVDIDLSVLNTEDEDKYLHVLENIGFTLIVREPLFYGHRLFISKSPRINLYVFNPNSEENMRHILFRDWLKNNKEDRELYESTKKIALNGNSQDIKKYYEKKQEVVLQIYNNIFSTLKFKK